MIVIAIVEICNAQIYLEGMTNNVRLHKLLMTLVHMRFTISIEQD